MILVIFSGEIFVFVFFSQFVSSCCIMLMWRTELTQLESFILLMNLNQQMCSSRFTFFAYIEWKCVSGSRNVCINLG